MSEKIQLDIAADTSKATAEVGKLEKAQDKLGKATGNAAKAAVAQAAAEVEGAKALDTTTKIAVRATKTQTELVEAIKKETAARKTAAGWAKLSNDAENKSFADARKRIATQAKMADEIARTRSEAGGLSKVFGGSAKAAAAAGAAIAVVGVALDEFTAAHTRAMDAAKRSDSAASGLMGFIGLQAQGEEGQAHVQSTVVKGARAGLDPEATGAIAEAIQSIVDADGNRKLEGDEKKKFNESFGAATQLGQLGVNAEDIQNLITAGLVRGQEGSLSADKAVVAAGASKLNEGDFAKNAAAMQQWGDSDAALAAVAAMSRTESKAELPTLTRSAALALGEGGESSEFSKQFGLKGSEAEKIAKLREIGAEQGTGATAEERIASFSKRLGEFGLDETKSRAVGAIMREGVAFEQTLEAVRGVKSGANLTGARIGELKKDPVALSLMQSREAAAMQKASDLYGPEQQAARDKRAAALSRGAELETYGGSRAVDPITGEEKGMQFSANPLEAFGVFSEPNRDVIAGRASAMVNGMPGTGFNKGGANQDRSMSSPQQLEQTLNKLAESLDRNTAATEANSTSTKNTRPVGGAASNAEEKY